MLKLFLSIFFLLSPPLSAISLTNKIEPIPFNEQQIFKELHTIAPTLQAKVLHSALHAYHTADSEGKLKKKRLTIIDYSLPSNKPRLWVFDLKRDTLLYNTFVAHGKNSGSRNAHHFSNIPQSKSSSLGAYITKGTYFGNKGYSLNLQGLEKGFNDNAYSRRIVMHGAWYVDDNYIKRQGYAGRSWGCPAVSRQLAKPIINDIKGGSMVFAYYPEAHWLHSSHFV